MTDEAKQNMIHALNGALIAFQNINAPMTIQNVQYQTVVITNIQVAIKTVQDDDKKQFNKQADEAKRKAEEAANKAN